MWLATYVEDGLHLVFQVVTVRVSVRSTGRPTPFPAFRPFVPRAPGWAGLSTTANIALQRTPQFEGHLSPKDISIQIILCRPFTFLICFLPSRRRNTHVRAQKCSICQKAFAQRFQGVMRQSTTLPQAHSWLPRHSVQVLPHGSERLHAGNPRSVDVLRAREILRQSLQDTITDDEEPSLDTQIFYAAGQAEEEQLRQLILQCGRVTATTCAGLTVLHVAAGTGHVPSVQLLLDNGAHTKATPWSGRTVLHCAVTSVKLPLKADASPAQQNWCLFLKSSIWHDVRDGT